MKLHLSGDCGVKLVLGDPLNLSVFLCWGLMLFKSLKPMAVASAATILVGCTLLYPRFDSLLNPDVALLNAGDVVDSVKCAVTTFFIKHREPIEVDTRKFLHAHVPKPPTDNKSWSNENFYCPKHPNWADPEQDPKGWQLALFVREASGELACVADFESGIRINKDRITIRRKDRKPEESHTPIPTTKWKEEEVVRWIATNLGELLLKGRDCQPYFHAYRYIKLEEIKDKSKARLDGTSGLQEPREGGLGKRYRCIPNGGCRPGTSFQEEGKCALNETGRLVIDPNSNAKIELSLTAVNQGSMNYQRIDGTKLGILKQIIVPGDSSKGFPFPALKATDKKTNKVEISISMPQGRIQEDKKDEATVYLIRLLEQARALVFLPRKRPAIRLQAVGEPRKLTQDEVDRLTKKVHADLERAAGQYTERCASDRLKVGFLGLADYIDKIVSEQDEQIYRGTPDVSLESVVLTSSFQIVFDATAGTEHLLRIVPVLAPPVLQLNPDHTHQLKITFSGDKGRSTRAKALSLLRRCQSRLQAAYLQQDEIDRFCRLPQAVQLESLIDAVENSKSGSN